jgi:succinate dehydrogenase / fumarate reductase flavoprotein subunit
MPVKAYSLTHHAYDVIIVGAGGSGLRAASIASRLGLRAACITKVPPTHSHTAAAQGGINAALGNRTPDDWRWHTYDTIRGSDWLGDQDAIALMCEKAPAAIRELEHMGMPFTRAGDGRIYQRAYGGQATYWGKGPLAYRACAVADRTGHALLYTLYNDALKHQARFFVEYLALDLIMDDAGACRGVLALCMETGELHAFRAHAVILATGGYGYSFASTTASSICTGDGGGMALRAGISLQDMEFVQYHPTGLYDLGVLITEGARGEGGYLVNGKGERFMERYAPKFRDLASRDVISRAIMREIRQGRGCGPKKDHVELLLHHVEQKHIMERLPSIISLCKTFLKLDATRQPIPVLPAVHYTMGGIPTDAGCRVIAEDKPVPGLFAIGEAACNSVHGANRLGCNALLDLVIFGEIAAQGVKSGLPSGAPSPLASGWLERPLSRLDQLRYAKGSVRPALLRERMRAVMHEHAGVYRRPESMEEGLRRLQALWIEFRVDLGLSEPGLAWNNDLSAALELDNMLRQSLATLASALARPESRGAHYREDFPERDDARWLAHSLAAVDENGHVALSKRSVRFLPEGGELSFPPEPRAY